MKILISTFISVPYTSKTQERSAEEVPVVGSNKRFICSPENEGFPLANRATWYKDGLRIRESKKYQTVTIYEYAIFFQFLI